MKSKIGNSKEMAIQIALMKQRAKRKVRQRVKSLWKLLLAQHGIKASEGGESYKAKGQRAKSKYGIKIYCEYQRLSKLANRRDCYGFTV